MKTSMKEPKQIQSHESKPHLQVERSNINKKVKQMLILLTVIKVSQSIL